MINIQPLQGARRLDRAADSAVLYGTLGGEYGDKQPATKGILYYRHLLRSIINWGEILLYMVDQMQIEDLYFIML